MVSNCSSVFVWSSQMCFNSPNFKSADAVNIQARVQPGTPLIVPKPVVFQEDLSATVGNSQAYTAFQTYEKKNKTVWHVQCYIPTKFTLIV